MTGGDPFSLEIEGLSAGYRHRPVIRDLTIDPVRSGEVTALVGPNAAGKSTLLRALAGLVHTEGVIRLDSEDLSRLTLPERASRVGFMPQTLPQGVGLSVLESVLSALRATPGRSADGGARRQALAALERVGIIDSALEPLDHLSGGQRQLASLAQSIVRAPRLLLLDEPTSALDLRHQVGVMSIARSLAREGRIVVVVLHDLNLAAYWSDRIIVLQQGRVHASGSPETAVTPDMLESVYGVAGRVERCSRGRLQVMVDGPARR